MEEKRLKENRHLREQLDKLLKEARRNEQTQTSFDDFSLSVVAAQGPEELFDLILHDQKKFRIDEIRLCLVDRFHEVERLLTESYQNKYSGLSFIDTETSNLLISDIPDRPMLGLSQNGNGMSVSSQATLGKTYQLQKASSLVNAKWQNLGKPVTATSSRIIVTDANASDTSTFYRIIPLD